MSLSLSCWASHWRVHGETAINAAVVWTLQADTLGLHVHEVKEIKSEDNWRCVMLSRGKSWSDVVARDPTLRVILSLTVVDSSYILSASDPRKELSIDQDRWLAAHSEL